MRFLGRREDVRDILMQCDVMALSSDTEQMPLVVLEAMDAGLPIAATNVGDVGYMVCEENRRYIVTGSDDDLCTAMRALVMEEARRKEIGAKNQQRVRQAYTACGMTAAYRALLLKTAEYSDR